MIQIKAEWQIDKQLNWTDLNSTLIMQVADHDDDKNYVKYRGFVVRTI